MKETHLQTERETRKDRNSDTNRKIIQTRQCEVVGERKTLRIEGKERKEIMRDTLIVTAKNKQRDKEKQNRKGDLMTTILDVRCCTLKYLSWTKSNLWHEQQEERKILSFNLKTDRNRLKANEWPD